MTKPETTIQEEKIRIVRRAAEIVRNSWFKGYFACREDGSTTSYDNAKACAWCAAGSLLKAQLEITGEDNFDTDVLDLWTEVDNFIRPIKGTNLVDFNDTHAQSGEDVAAIFDQFAESLA